MFRLKWATQLLLVTAVSLFAVSAPTGCRSSGSKPAGSKSCGDPGCDTKH